MQCKRGADGRKLGHQSLQTMRKHLRWRVSTVRNNNPQQHRFEFALWTLRLIGPLCQAR